MRGEYSRTPMRLDECHDWLETARAVPSPNCDARPAGTSIRLLVIHGISLPTGEFGGGFVEQLFRNALDVDAHPDFASLAKARVSAHLFIDREGRLTQFVPFGKRAWHAGASSFRDCQGCNDFSIGIELEGTDALPYRPVQYRVLAAVTDCLVAHWPLLGRDTIAGHEHIAPGRKTDPGPAFDWEGYYSLCKSLQ